MSHLPEALELFYQSHWQERWPALLAALKAEPIPIETPPSANSQVWPRQIIRLNPFCSEYPTWQTQLKAYKIPLPDCYLPPPSLGLFQQAIPRGEDGLFVYYILDPASVWIAHQLDVQPDHSTLDMCAAPGGKTLVLAAALGSNGVLTANEPSPDRRQRLIKNIRGYLPEGLRQQVWVTGRNGGLFAKSAPQSFDRILIDAPCSGERFLFSEPPEKWLSWSPKRSQRLAQEQYALLTAGLIALKPGGLIVFSTCSLSPLENDPVIEKLIHKKADQFKIETLKFDLPITEKTRFGYQILPDKAGCGPFYLSLIRKNA